MSDHHNHESHTHNFLNKHTAFAVLVLIVGCFLAGFFVGERTTWENKYESVNQGTVNNTNSGSSSLDSVDDLNY